MRISEYELITEIATLCDELEATKRELSDMERDIATYNDMGENKPISAADLLCLKVGRKKIFVDCTCSWCSVQATRNEETGAIGVTTFERFRDNIFDRCPDSMSKKEFYEYFGDDFRARYDEEKAKAIANLEAEEADND